MANVSAVRGLPQTIPSHRITATPETTSENGYVYKITINESKWEMTNAEELTPMQCSIRRYSSMSRCSSHT